MPPIESGPHGGDIPPLPDTPPNHAHILKDIAALQSPIRDIFQEAIRNAGQDVAQQKYVSEARLEEALSATSVAATRLAEAEVRYTRTEAEGHQRYWHAERAAREAESRGQLTAELDDKRAQIHHTHYKALRQVNASIQALESRLKDTLDDLKHVMTETFQGLPEAIAAIEPRERDINLRPGLTSAVQEAELLDAKLLVARMDLETLSEMLEQTASPTASRATERPQSASPISDLPLGVIDLDTFLKTAPPWWQHTLGNVVRLYHAAEHEPDNHLIQTQLGLLPGALEGIWGETALGKTDNLCNQLYNYGDLTANFSHLQEGYGFLPEEEARVRFNMLQFDIPLIFRNRGNNPS